MKDTLNDILVECSKLRGCYPMIHRTLHEFDWFCTSVIWGADPQITRWIEEAREAGDYSSVIALEKRRDLENDIKDKYACGRYDDDELIRLAKAFMMYCRKKYASCVQDV